MPLLPDQPLPSLRRAGTPPTARQVDRCDVLCIVTQPGKPLPTLPRQLGYSMSLNALLARMRLQPGQCAAVTLPNARQTLAVIGVLASNADAYVRLALAGKMLREALQRRPTRAAFMYIGPDDQAAGALEALAAAALAQSFDLPSFRREVPAQAQLTRIDLHGASAELDLARIAATARAGNLARWLTALPPNKLDAGSYRRLLTRLARTIGARLTWYSESQLRRLGAGAFLAVSAGNARRDAGIARLTWSKSRARRRSRAPDVALVGKGILFDTGGTNLKSHRSMLDMHTDMAGSAVALGTFMALAELRSPLSLECWLAITENRIGPQAYCPQDVVRAANGVTIQVIHTDAEGRLALADTLALAGRSRPRLMLDFATLTGACVHALTERMSGVFTNREPLAPLLERAGRSSGERVVCFPMDADFDTDLDSKVADIMQCAVDGKGDHILAARFLRRFVPEGSAWAHVDLAAATRHGGLAHVTTDITGFGVRFALDLLLDQNAVDKT